MSVDLGPAQVRGVLTAGKARVLWYSGYLYVATGVASVRRFACPEPPTEPAKPSGFWSASTAEGVVEFRRRGCSCSYSLGRFAVDRLVDAATPPPGHENG